MCGIAGVVSFRDPVDSMRLRCMTDRMVHRGPDDSGVWVSPEGHVGLASRRLEILDLSAAGRMPMTADSSNLWITFNGELYNYVELRDELRQYGHVFKTSTDTEVVLLAYRQWGPECLKKFNGMFALAIWDGPAARLFAARDRFGEKPFYYHQTAERFLFASEIKALLVDKTVPRTPDAHAIARYIGLALVDGERGTFFEGIKQLPPAHYLLIDARGHLELHRYWDVNFDREVRRAREDEYAEEFRALFIDAVRLRLRSDVAVGSSLSGGLDSSSIVGAIAALRGADAPAQNTFSARYRDSACDEGRFIDDVVSRTGVQAHSVWIDGSQLLGDVERFICSQEEPVAGTSQFAQWKVMELASRAGVTVLLDGQGADEVIGGYPSPSFGYRYAELLRSGNALRLLGELVAFRRTHGRIMPAMRYLGGALLSPDARARWRTRYLGTQGLMPDGWRHFGDGTPPRSNGRRRTRILQETLYESAMVTSLPSLLRYGDRNSMAFSREARLPFLDHRLVEFVFTLPSEQLVSGAMTKVILRRAMRGLVPESVLQRTDKIGFATPERDWMLGPLRGWMMQHLQETKNRGLLDARAVDREWQRLLAGASNSGNLWRIVNLEAWCQRFIDAS